MNFTAFEKEEHGVWMVEAIDDTSEGEMLWAEFSGHAAQERALKYAKWMNSRQAARKSHHQYIPNVSSRKNMRRAKAR